jgi:cation diffusion facilitator CzcD-associated flavoprotein CzcO
MKLYRAKVSAIAKDVIEVLAREEDIEVRPESKEEAEKDLVAIMEEYLRRDNELRNEIRDHMHTRNIPYDEYGKARKAIIDQTRQSLGPDFDVETHFSPRYNPWDQRLCLAPDGDFFESLKSGEASVVTDEVETFTGSGLRLKSGAEIEADIVVTATGLKLEAMNGIALSVDGEAVRPSETLSYKGMMYSGVPNLASAFGYTNASWTLKCDLTCEYVCRLLNHMRRKRLRQCTPILKGPPQETAPWLDFSSGYVQRQGTTAPWRLHQNYALDMAALRFARLEDGAMTFTNPAPSARRAA